MSCTTGDGFATGGVIKPEQVLLGERSNCCACCVGFSEALAALRKEVSELKTVVVVNVNGERELFKRNREQIQQAVADQLKRSGPYREQLRGD
jgi:hypothetical protein